MVDLQNMISPILIALIGAGGVILSARQNKRSKGDITVEQRDAFIVRQDAIIDQMQEDRAADRTRIDALGERLSALEDRVRRLLSRDAIWDVHATRVEAQVVDLGGQPHPRPPELQEQA